MQASAQTFWLENLKTANNYNTWIFSQIQPWLGNEVLEVGCGNGNFSELIAQNCQQLLALDLDETYVQMTRNRLRHCPHVKILNADATQMNWKNQFDSIVMLDVLEHIENDIGILQTLSQALKPGGTLILKVPALESLYTPMDKAIGHYRRYHRKSLTTALSRANFLQPNLWYFNVAGIPGWWFNGKVLRRETPPSSQVGLFDKVVPLLQTIESINKPFVGLSLFAIAAKP